MRPIMADIFHKFGRTKTQASLPPSWSKADMPSRNSLAVLLTCPGSRLANELRATGKLVWIPTKEDMQGMTHDDLVKAVAHASTCYGYRLAQKLGDEYVYLRNSPGGELAFDPLDG